MQSRRPINNSDAFTNTNNYNNIKSPSQQTPDTPQSNISSTPSNGNANANGTKDKPAPISLEQSRQIARTHYTALKSWLIRENGLGNQSQRGNAREKLTRLTRQQFQELSTDVYDELVRRMEDDQGRPGEQPFLPVRSEFHPKRNQARQKLATLPLTRFRDLASDVYYELDRRYPEFAEEEDTMPSPPQPLSQSQTSPTYNSPSTSNPNPNNQNNNNNNNGYGHSHSNSLSRSTPSNSNSNNNSISRRIPAPSSNQGSSVGGPAGGGNTNDVVVPNKSTLVLEMEDEPSNSGGYGPKESVYGGVSQNQGQKGHSKNVSSVSGAYGAGNQGEYEQEQLNSPGGTGMGMGRGNGGGPGTRASETSSVGTRFIGNYAGSERRSEQWEYEEKDKVTSEYEYKITMMQNRLDGLAKENEELKEASKNRAGEASKIRDLESQVRTHRERYDDQSSVLTSVRRDLESLQQLQASRSLTTSANPNELSRLRAEVSEMESLSNELRTEVSNLVDELRSVNGRYEELQEEREREKSEKSELENEARMWKKKFEQAKTDLRNTRATSQIFSGGIKLDRDHMPASSDGLVADVHVTAFQTSIDELLQAARSKEPSSVLPAVRAVVAAVEKIDSDVQAADPQRIANLALSEQDRLQSLKGKTNATLSNLMTACKNHATSFGVSPVSLLDAAASHLSATVVDLVRLLRIKKTSGGQSIPPVPPMTMNSPPPPLPPLKSNGYGSSTNPGANSYDNGGDTLRGQRPAYSEASSTSPAIRSPPLRGASSLNNDYSRSLNNSRSYAQQQQQQPTDDDRYRGGASPGYSQASSSYRSHPDERFNSPNQGSDRMSGYQQDGYGAPRDNYQQPAGATRGSVLTYGSPNLGGLDDQMRNQEQSLESYLETQTEAIVNSIQSLLSAIRGGAQSEQLNENLTQIITIVSSIVAMSKDNLPVNARAEGEQILHDLTDNCDKLSEMQSQTSASEVLPKQTKQAMASASFGVAKSLKALNALWTR